MQLRKVAHCRAGDKGNTSNVCIIAYHQKHYPLLLKEVTAERVRRLLGSMVAGNVTRYELPKLGALNFVLDQALGGGVTRSLALDAHGKALSSALLRLEIADALP
jgi:hypothetical protein